MSQTPTVILFQSFLKAIFLNFNPVLCLNSYFKSVQSHKWQELKVLFSDWLFCPTNPKPKEIQFAVVRNSFKNQ